MVYPPSFPSFWFFLFPQRHKLSGSSPHSICVPPPHAQLTTSSFWLVVRACARPRFPFFYLSGPAVKSRPRNIYNLRGPIFPLSCPFRSPHFPSVRVPNIRLTNYGPARLGRFFFHFVLIHSTCSLLNPVFFDEFLGPPV